MAKGCVERCFFTTVAINCYKRLSTPFPNLPDPIPIPRGGGFSDYSKPLCEYVSLSPVFITRQSTVKYHSNFQDSSRTLSRKNGSRVEGEGWRSRNWKGSPKMVLKIRGGVHPNLNLLPTTSTEGEALPSNIDVAIACTWL